MNIFLLVLALAPAQVLAGPMRAQVENLEARLEGNFRRADTVTSILYESPQSDRIVDLTDFGDSALWTGVYLASQCFKQAVEAREGLVNSNTDQRVRALVSALDTLFEVTGVPGYMARFAFHPAWASLAGLGISRLDPATTPGWQMSPTRPGMGFIGPTSRDQYTGLIFGLGICYALSSDAEVRARAAQRMASTVRALKDNQWTIPCGGCKTSGNAHLIRLPTRTSWLQLAALVSSAEFATEYDRSRRETEESWTELISEFLGLTVYNNYLEYYAFNLGYLRYYTFLSFEKDVLKRQTLQSRFLETLWEETRSHQNTMFTYMKVGLLGATADDQIRLDEAHRSLEMLLARDRRDYAVINSTRKEVPQSLVAKMGSWISKKVETYQSGRPLPLNERPYEDFFWQRSPFKLDGNGDGRTASPAVDSIVAYWLGRYHGLLSASE